MAANADDILRQLPALKQARQPHENGWQECFDYSWPDRGRGLVSSILTAEEAQTKRNRILDDTAADSGRTLASALVGGTTPANSIWFGMDAGAEAADDDDAQSEEQRWLDDAARTVFANIHAANFDAAAYECALDITGAGWFVLYIDEAPEGGYHFEQWPLGECFVAASKAGGMVDTIYRETSRTVEQLVKEFGFDRVSSEVKQAYSNQKYSEQVAVVHAIYPRRVAAVDARMARNLPFASCKVEVKTKHMLSESGYHEFPCAVPRWTLSPGSCYGVGPMASALGSIRTINDIKAAELANLDLAVAGMWIAEDDGVLNPRAIKLGPRKVIVANSVDSIKPLAPSADFTVAFSAEDRLQASIRRLLLADQLQPQDGPAMTATEVHVRVQLIRQLLGPIYGRLQSEYLSVLVLRCFAIAMRAGILGTPPDALRGRSVNVRYISPLARAQRLEEVTAMDRLETTLIAEAQADPTVLDLYDFEVATRARSRALGVPSDVLRSNTKVAELRAKREQAQQQQARQAQQMQMQQAGGEALIKQATA